MTIFRRKHEIWFALILSTVLLTSCSGEGPGLSPTQTEIPIPTDTPVPAETLTPTVTPLPPVGVLLAPPETDSNLLEEIQNILSESIPAAGYRFQIRPSLSSQDFDRDEIQLVVALPPNPGIATLAADHPETRFLTVGIQDLESAPNLSTIGSDRNRLDQQGFIAGYTAALITPDWRVGVIGLSDHPLTLNARQAFETGVEYYCGLCLPVYGPFYEYPLFFELSADADTAEWRAAADYMIHRMVETVYVVPGAGDDAMLRHLAQSGVHIIAGKSHLSDISDHWVVSLEFDLFQAFLEYFPAFLEGSNSQNIPVILQISDNNPDLLSPGRLRLVEKILDDVLAGFVDLGINDE